MAYLDEAGLEALWGDIETLVGEAGVADGSITTAKIADGAVTDAKLSSYGIKILATVILSQGLYTIEGSFINSTNGEETLAGTNIWRATDYVDVSSLSGTTINVTMPTFINANVGGMAFYDSGHNYISGVAGSVGTANSYEYVDILVPETANYARFSIRATHFAYVKTLYGGRLVEAVEQLDSDVDELKANSSSLSKLIDVVISSDSYTSPRTAINSTTGEVIISNGWSATGYIDVSGFAGETITVTMPTFINANVGGMAFYDGSRTYISGVAGRTGRSLQYEDRSISVPDDAVYARFSIKTEHIPNVKTLYGGRLGKDVEQLESDVEELKVNSSGNIAMQLFEKIGVIGDSISVGWAKTKSGTTSNRNIGISWVQQMARRLGCKAYNLGASGVDPITWFQSSFAHAQYCYSLYQTTEECQLYIIGLGINGGTIGSVSDINQSDYTQNAETFYGQYARIVQMINHDHPNSIVMCLTEPTTLIHAYDQAIRNICALNFINAELVDLENDYFDVFNTSAIMAEHQPDDIHYTPYGYSLIANAMMYSLSDYISKNSSAFKYVGVA